MRYGEVQACAAALLALLEAGSGADWESADPSRPGARTPWNRQAAAEEPELARFGPSETALRRTAAVSDAASGTVQGESLAAYAEAPVTAWTAEGLAVASGVAGPGVGTAQTLGQDGAETPVTAAASAVVREDAARSMEDIDRFFRRDSRRYDGGFRGA